MSIPLFDAHCDTLTAVYKNGGGLFENSYMVDIVRLSEYTPVAQVFAVWNGHYKEKVSLLWRACAAHATKVSLCRSAQEVRQANVHGRVAALLSVEGAENLDCDIEKLRAAHNNDGVVMINLCWNSDNALCGAAMGSGSGLTTAGREFVRECQSMGVAVDMSHASERTFWETMEIAQKPVIASHSDSKTLCGAARNLTDNQFKVIAASGGGAGINLCPEFLKEDGAGIDDVVRHIEHFLGLGGEGSVFLGADFDGIDSTPNGISGVQDMEKLYDELLHRNYPEQLVRAIFYDNFMHILERMQ